VRHWIGTTVIIALAAVAPQTLATLSASAVSVLLESVPYLAVATALTPLVGRFAHTLVAYTGCGCGSGPSARSIPAAIATAAIFGTTIALARVLLASVIARVHRHHEEVDGDLLSELVGLVPSALLAATIMQLVPMVPLHHLHPLLLWCAGALLGLAATPCALGGVALAASLHASAPIAALGVLCTAGIVPGIRVRHTNASSADPIAYGLLALVCALIAAHHGGTLVHPRMTIPLALCAIYCAVVAWRSRAHTACAPRWIAAVALAVVIIGAPQPAYRATETTLADAFAGERVDFTGVAVHERTTSALVRYAITCCRADAAPVALALDRNLASFDGRWMHARGVIEDDGGALRLHVAELVPVAPPSDPFVYR
jgi:hypothetical protein